jgi:hypothetical protein
MLKVRLILFAVVSVIVPPLVFAHGGHKHVIGTISSVASKTLVVKTTTGNVSVPISNTTRFYHGSGTQQEATAAEVQKGMRVVVHLDGDGSAAEVHIPERDVRRR